jgi:hypothetical protein
MTHVALILRYSDMYVSRGTKDNHCCFFVASKLLLLSIVGGGKRSSERRREFIVALTWQQWLRGYAPLLRCMYMPYLVQI